MMVSLTSHVALLRGRQRVCAGRRCGGRSPQVGFQREKRGSEAVTLCGLLSICFSTAVPRLICCSCTESPVANLSLTLDLFCPREKNEDTPISYRHNKYNLVENFQTKTPAHKRHWTNWPNMQIF